MVFNVPHLISVVTGTQLFKYANKSGSIKIKYKNIILKMHIKRCFCKDQYNSKKNETRESRQVREMILINSL